MLLENIIIQQMVGRPSRKLTNVIHLLLLVLISLLVLLGAGNVTTSDQSQQTKGNHSNQPIIAADRIRNEPESVWVEFVQLALDYKPLNFGQGFPDFAAPKYLMDRLANITTNRVDEKTILLQQYTRPFGHPRLIRALLAYYKKFRGFDELKNANEQFLITVGAYEALYVAIMAFVNPGDQVLIIEPAFDAYAPMVSMAGGSSVYIPLRFVSDDESSEPIKRPNNSSDERVHVSSSQFRLNLTQLEEKIVANRTKVLILNTPNNPLGKIFSLEELNSLASLCKQHNLLVIADEVYEQFYYNDKLNLKNNDRPGKHLSIASLPGMWNRTVTIGSAGKTFSVTGWKIGWAFGPSELIKYLQLVHQTTVYTVATPLQEALAQTFEHEMQQLETSQASSYWQELRSELELKRNRMAHLLAKAKFKPIIPQGGYFMFASFGQLLDHLGSAKGLPITQNQTVAVGQNKSGGADFKFARWLAKEKHLQGIPGGAFYSDDHKHLASDLIRFCFIKKWPTFDALERLIDSWQL